MKQLRNFILFSTLFTACLLFGPNIIKADLNCSTLLKNGSTGAEVKTLQTELNKVMGCNLATDGIFGSGTKACVVNFQKKYSLTADGIVGSATCSKLNSVYNAANNKVEDNKTEDNQVTVNTVSDDVMNCRITLQNGSSYTSEVKKLQTELNKVMGCKLTVDGKFGSGTKACVVNFQKKYNLTADGIAGISTCSKLNVEYLSSNNYVIVNTSKLNIRDKATTTNSTILGSTTYGAVFKVYGSTVTNGATWYKIKYNGKDAYIYASYTNKDGIVVDISSQKLSLYKGGKLKLDALVITGNVSEGNDTPTGHFTFYEANKIPGQYLTDHRTYNVWVDYWMPFNRGIGFHDAEIHSANKLHSENAPEKVLKNGHGSRGIGDFKNIDTYKTNGSHGCINMLNADAKALYEAIDKDITVDVVK